MAKRAKRPTAKKRARVARPPIDPGAKDSISVSIKLARIADLHSHAFRPSEIARELGMRPRQVKRYLGRIRAVLPFDPARHLRELELRHTTERRLIYRRLIACEKSAVASAALFGELRKLEQVEHVIFKDFGRVRPETGMPPSDAALEELRRLPDAEYEAEAARIVELERDTEDPSRFERRLIGASPERA